MKDVIEINGVKLNERQLNQLKYWLRMSPSDECMLDVDIALLSRVKDTLLLILIDYIDNTDKFDLRLKESLQIILALQDTLTQMLPENDNGSNSNNKQKGGNEE